MAGKFLNVEEAAEKLGVSAEQLIEMRSEGKVHGYRDGASWKFKADEIDRAADEMGAGAGDSGLLPFDDDLDELISMDSADVTDDPLLESGSGTVVGKEEPIDGGSELSLAGNSDLNLASPSDLDLGDPAGMSDLVLGADDELSSLGENSDIDLDSPSAGDHSGISDALEFGGGSDLELGSDDDEELVLEGSGIGSDVTLGAGDTGINLAEPSESGLDLEEPMLELEGSHASSLELPEDDDMIALETDIADPDDATQLKQDEEFLLQPMDDHMHDESDSGSQVIALEDSEILDENAATMLGGQDMLAAPVLMAEDPLGGGPSFTAPDASPFGQADPNMGSQPQHTPMMQPAAYEPPEAPYSIWNVLALLCSVLLLIVSGMLMVDVVRNIWSWQGNYEATSSIMEALVEACGMSN
ncbi:MAG: excisionase family DNA binding protein [Pirellulaceae bacterium]|jgi:excisionase family DNA binding protein